MTMVPLCRRRRKVGEWFVVTAGRWAGASGGWRRVLVGAHGNADWLFEFLCWAQL